MPGNKISAISVNKQQKYMVSHLTFRDPLDVPLTVYMGEITKTTALQLTSVLENGIVYFSAIGAPPRKETGG